MAEQTVYGLRFTVGHEIELITYVVDHRQAAAKIGQPVDIFTCPDKEHVGAVGEWSSEQGPINLIGWLFYGRSPVYQDVVVWRDDHGPLSDEIIGFARACRERIIAGDELLDIAQSLGNEFWTRARAEAGIR